MNEQLDYVPVYDEQAEMAALGGAIAEGGRWIDHAVAVLKLKEEAFYIPGNKIIFETMLEMNAERPPAPIDIQTLRNRLETLGKLERIGGVSRLCEMVDANTVTANTAYYFNLVRQKWIIRQVQEQAKILEIDARKEVNGEKLLLGISERFNNIIDAAVTEVDVKSIALKNIEDWKKADENKMFTGLPLPFYTLARLLGGLRTGMVVLAGRPSEGKTTMEDQIAVHLAEDGMHVARATNDSTLDELIKRVQCRKASVSLQKLNGGYAGRAQFGTMEEQAGVIGAYPMHLMANARNIYEICSWARMLKARRDIKLLTVDYIQNINTGDPRLDRDEVAKLTVISGELKGLAFELDIPVLVLSQLSRGVAKDGRDPEMSDIRGCGTIEQDASVILFVYRDQEMSARVNSSGTITHYPTWVKIGKNKSGARDIKLPYWFAANYYQFSETRDWGLTPDEWQHVDKVLEGN